MTKIRRIRALLAINKDKIVEVQTRAQLIYNGLDADKVTYSEPNPTLPVFLGLIENLGAAQQVVPARTRGAAAARDVQRDLLVTGMEAQRMYVQILADASPARAISLIQNAGMVVAEAPVHPKPLLKLTLAKQPGSVDCDAHVGLLVAAAAAKPRASRFFNWGYTLDGGATYITAPSTPTGKTTIAGLPLLTLVGVRVNLNSSDGPDEWSQVVYILVH